MAVADFTAVGAVDFTVAVADFTAVELRITVAVVTGTAAVVAGTAAAAVGTAEAGTVAAEAGTVAAIMPGVTTAVAGVIPATVTDGVSVLASTGDRFGAVTDIPIATLGFLPTIHMITPTRIPIPILTTFPLLRRPMLIRPILTTTGMRMFQATAAAMFPIVLQPSNRVPPRSGFSLLRRKTLLPQAR